MDKQTILAESQITESPHDIVTIELVEPDNMPAAVRIALPLQPSVIDPPRFRDTAAAMVKLFSDAHITLARIKARRRL
jgi:hypothetical protein